MTTYQVKTIVVINEYDGQPYTDEVAERIKKGEGGSFYGRQTLHVEAETEEEACAKAKEQVRADFRAGRGIFDDEYMQVVEWAVFVPEIVPAETKESTQEALASLLSNAIHEIADRLYDPFYGHQETGLLAGPIFPYLRKQMSEMGAIKDFYNGPPIELGLDAEQWRKSPSALKGVVSAFAKPIPKTIDGYEVHVVDYQGAWAVAVHEHDEPQGKYTTIEEAWAAAPAEVARLKAAEERNRPTDPRFTVTLTDEEMAAADGMAERIAERKEAAQ